ncbi:MAG: UbiA family prenyltransferase [Polyangiales bacterium]
MPAVTAGPKALPAPLLPQLLIGLRIVANTVVYRVRKLEMANLAAVGSIALALRLPPFEIAVRGAFAFLLNALVYLHNDYVDVELDISSTNKDTSNARYLAENPRAALYAQMLLLGLLAAVALSFDPGMFVPLVAGSVICVWYSAQLKYKAGWDMVATTLGGTAMTLCGTPMTNHVGWLMAVQLGFFSGAFEAIQVLRDADADAAAGLRTTGVVLGKRRGIWFARAMMLVSSIFCALVLQPWAAVISLTALLIPFDEHAVAQYWTRVKMVYGCCWLSVCAWIYFAGRAGGLLMP